MNGTNPVGAPAGKTSRAELPGRAPKVWARRGARLLCCLPAVLASGCSTPSPGGIYTGTMTLASTGATYAVMGAIDEAGAFQLINTTTSAQYSGSLTVKQSKSTSIDSNSTSTTGTFYTFDPTGAVATTATLSGTVVGRTTITASYTLASGDTGTLNLTYSTQYATPVSLATAAGSYQWTSTRNGGISKLVFGSDGALGGTTEYGCTFTGTAAVIDSKYDLFSLTITPASSTACGSSAGTTLTGLAYYTAATTTAGATLVAASTNTVFGSFANYVRQ